MNPQNVSTKKRKYQPQKIYIEKISNDINIKQIESDLIDYFSVFGTIIDCKVLRNGSLKRFRSSICLCDISGRRGCLGSVKSRTCLQKLDSGIISYRLNEHLKKLFQRNQHSLTRTIQTRYLSGVFPTKSLWMKSSSISKSSGTSLMSVFRPVKKT